MNTSSIDSYIVQLADSVSAVVLKRLANETQPLCNEGLRLVLLCTCIQDLLNKEQSDVSYSDMISKIPNRRSATYIPETYYGQCS